MILITESIKIIQLTEIIILLLNLSLFYYEFLSLKPVLRNRVTLSLLGFLIMLMGLRITRITGIGLENIFIRTYLTAILGFFAGILFINWGSLVIGLSRRQKFVYFGMILVGLIGFVFSRFESIVILETLSVFWLITPTIILMIQIFRFVFKNSPYIRARQRLFVLSVSFLCYVVLEAIAVSNMGVGDFQVAAIYLFLTIPARIGIALSILLPTRLTNVLSKFIR